MSSNSGSSSSRHQSRAVRQLSNGLLVSGGPPDPPTKDRPPALPSRSPVPYTGGDVRCSGELGKMLSVDPNATTPSSSRSHSGPLRKAAAASSSSGPLSQIPPTGLITGRSSSGSLQPDPDPDRIPRRRAYKKKEYGTSVTEVKGRGVHFSFAVPRAVVYAGVVAFLIGLGIGILVVVVMGKFVILVAVAGAVAIAGAVGVWNWGWGRREIERFLREFPDTGIDARNLPVGQIVKVTGVMCDLFFLPA